MTPAPGILAWTRDDTLLIAVNFTADELPLDVSRGRSCSAAIRTGRR